MCVRLEREPSMANGLRLQAFDPAAIGQAKLLMPKVVCCESPYHCAEGADVLVSARSGTLAKRDGNARCRGPARHSHQPEELESQGSADTCVEKSENDLARCKQGQTRS